MKKFLNNGYVIEDVNGPLIGTCVVFILAVIAAVVITVAIRSCNDTSNYVYDYVDMDGNEGQSSYCRTVSHGTLLCELGEKGRVQVKQYQGRKISNGD